MNTCLLNLKSIMHLKKTATADSRLWLINCLSLNFVEPLKKKNRWRNCSINISFLVLAVCSFMSYCTILLHLFWEVCTFYSYSYWLILPVEHQLLWSFLFRAISYTNYIFNFHVLFSKQHKYLIVYVNLVGKLKI